MEQKLEQFETHKFRHFSLFLYFEDFEGLNEQVIPIQCTERNLCNLPKPW